MNINPSEIDAWLEHPVTNLMKTAIRRRWLKLMWSLRTAKPEIIREYQVALGELEVFFQLYPTMHMTNDALAQSEEEQDEALLALFTQTMTAAERQAQEAMITEAEQNAARVVAEQEERE